MRKCCLYVDRRSSVVCLSVCLLMTFVSHAKTAESIEMPFESLTDMGTWNHLLQGINIGRIHSQARGPRGVTSQRCGLLSKLIDQLFIYCCHAFTFLTFYILKFLHLFFECPMDIL